MKLAIAEASLSNQVDSAYCVGAVLVRNGVVLSTGFSRELPGNTHAEECALVKLATLGVDAKGATLYSTMEPCSERMSGNTPCTHRIIEAGVGRVIVGVREPNNFVCCQGGQQLENAGIPVFFLQGLEAQCLGPNSHLPGLGIYRLNVNYFDNTNNDNDPYNASRAFRRKSQYPALVRNAFKPEENFDDVNLRRWADVDRYSVS